MEMSKVVLSNKIIKNVVFGSLFILVFWNRTPQLSATTGSIDNRENVHRYDKEATLKLRNLLFPESIPVDMCKKLI